MDHIKFQMKKPNKIEILMKNSQGLNAEELFVQGLRLLSQQSNENIRLQQEQTLLLEKQMLLLETLSTLQKKTTKSQGRGYFLKCIIVDCTNDKHGISDFCDHHACDHPGCLNKSLDCPIHCIIINCTDINNGTSRYCVKHEYQMRT